MKSQMIFATILSTMMIFGCVSFPHSIGGDYPEFQAYKKEGGSLSLWEWIEAGRPSIGEDFKIGNLKITFLKRDKSNLLIGLSSGQVLTIKDFDFKDNYLVTYFYRGVPILSQAVKRGEKLQKPVFGTIDTDEWYTNDTFSEAWNFADFHVVGSLNLYAKTVNDKDKETSSVSFIDPQFNINPLSKRYIIGEQYSLPNLVDRKSKYRFLGWKDENGTIINNEGIWSIPRHLTLVAVWRKKAPFEEGHFGLYPQTVVKDKELIKILGERSLKTENVSANSRYVEYEGEWYQKGVLDSDALKAKDYYFSDQKTKIENGKTYYFKVEPLEWKLIDIGHDECIAITKKVVESLFYVNDFDNKMTHNGRELPFNDYYYSHLRRFLNRINGKKEFGDWASDCSGDRYGLTVEKLFLNKEESALLLPYEEAYNDKFFILSKIECERYLSKEDLSSDPTDNFLAFYSERKHLPTKGAPWWTRSAYTGDRKKSVVVKGDGSFGSKETKWVCGLRFAIKIKKPATK